MAMVNKPRNKGTAAETAVVGYLQEHGWLHAERRSLHGQLDKGDITGTPGLAWEVKAGVSLKIGQWLVEAGIERLNASADHGILVVKPSGLGVKSVEQWYAVMINADFIRLKALADFRVNDTYHAENALGLFVVDGPCLAYTAATLRWALNSGLKNPTLAPNEVLALTLRPPGTKDKPEAWYRVLSLGHMARLLHAAGYGDGDGRGPADGSEARHVQQSD
jgi:hypothetical protein